MFRNFLLTAMRNMARYRMYTAINVLGLAVGIAACVLIGLFVRDELSYDTFWDEGEKVHRLHLSVTMPGKAPDRSVQSPGPMKHLIDTELSGEVLHSTRITGMNAILSVGDVVAKDQVHWTDPDFAQIFALELVDGDLETALADKYSLAVSESFANRYFGKSDAVGETLTVAVRRIDRDYKIAAVFKDIPRNSVLAVNALARIDEADFPGRFDGWTSYSGPLFFKKSDSVSMAMVLERLQQALDKNVQLPGAAFEGLATSEVIKAEAMALPDLYLNAEGWGEMKPTGNKVIVLVFATTAAFVLLIAGVNFSNLSTVYASKRAREMALRKTLGASRVQLMFQFLGESIVFALVALLVGLVIVDIVLPLYSSFLGRDLASLYDVTVVVGTGMLALLVGVCGGLYPALVLSRTMPGHILGTNSSAEARGTATLRFFLVIFQFSVSILLVVSTMVVYGQLSYIATADKGFNAENILVLGGARSQGVRDRQQAMKDALLALPEVEVAGFSWRVPGRGGGSATVELPGENAGSIRVGIVGRGYDFLDVYQIELLAGRTFERGTVRDGIPSAADRTDNGGIRTGTIVINKTASRRFGFTSPADAIGQIVSMEIGQTEQGPIKAPLEIIGVTNDVHFYSMKGEVQPEVHELVTAGAPYLSLRYTGDAREILPKIERTWKNIAPGVPFEPFYASQLNAADYAAEETFGSLMTVFAALAVIVACLGLYGLATFATDRRIKEIGIRKVLGARVRDIVRLLVWQFSKPVLWASLIALPVASWLMLQWLETFAYRIDNWLLVPIGLMASATALGVAWLTVGANAAKVARTKPITALRQE